ncbi:MAG: DNA-binding protein [Hyphomonadaceae bacterium]
MERLFITLAEAELRWGVKRRTLYNLAHRKHLKIVKCGRRSLIGVREGDAYFNALPTLGKGGD